MTSPAEVKDKIMTKLEPNTLNTIQIEMLKQMLNWREYAHNTNWFDVIKIGGKIITKKELLINMRELVKLGLVGMYRGGLSEDGEVVGGTHYCIEYPFHSEITRYINNQSESKGTE